MQLKFGFQNNTESVIFHTNALFKCKKTGEKKRTLLSSNIYLKTSYFWLSAHDNELGTLCSNEALLKSVFEACETGRKQNATAPEVIETQCPIIRVPIHIKLEGAEVYHSTVIL